MFPIDRTDRLAAEQLRRYVTSPELGGAPHLFRLSDHDGRPVDLMEDYLSGRTLFLTFVPALDHSDAARVIASLAASNDEIEALGGAVIIVTAESSANRNRALRRAANIPFLVLADAAGSAFAAYGLHKAGPEVSPTAVRIAAVSPYRRLRQIWDLEAMTDIAGDAIALLKHSREADAAAWAAPHPPVLVVPQVFSADECRRLIDEFESKDGFRINRPNPGEATQGYKLPTYEYGRQDRIDHVIGDRALLGFLDQRLTERVFPMVRHAFAFSVTRREDLHVARYSGPRGGVEIGHRDNRTATFHRRFALSLNLNDDYEGGGVVFREFTNRPYKNAAGSALVFSSSLLHEVEETTAGVRYTLISHFFDDVAAQQAQRR